MFPLFLVVILCVVGHCTGSERYFNALHFGTSSSDYVSFNPDMSAFQESLSVCAWIKRIYGSSYPTVLNYYHSSFGWEVMITANGYYTRVVGDSGLDNYRSRFTTPAGRWFHLCLTWAKSTTTSKLYLDGVLVGTDSTTSRSLYTGGTVYLGKLHPSSSSSSNYRFGGEVFNLNIFSEELSATEIKKAAQEGLCSGSLQDLESRVLKWEDILAKPRSGSVTNVSICALVKELYGELNVTKVRLATTETDLESTKEELAAVNGNLNKTEIALNSTLAKLGTTEETLNSTLEELTGTQVKLGTTEETLNSTLEELAGTQAKLGTTEETLNSTLKELKREIAQHNGTAEELETCSDKLFDTRSKLSAARKFENISRWDVLYTEPYYNRVFTDDLYNQLTTSWTMLRE